jgi:hypothetical protein
MGNCKTSFKNKTIKLLYFLFFVVHSEHLRKYVGISDDTFLRNIIPCMLK